MPPRPFWRLEAPWRRPGGLLRTGLSYGFYNSRQHRAAVLPSVTWTSSTTATSRAISFEQSGEVSGSELCDVREPHTLELDGGRSHARWLQAAALSGETLLS